MPDLDMGVEAIDTEAVAVPTEERIVGFSIELTRSDHKWMQFQITTTQRTVTVSPGAFGEEDFGIMCNRVKAMIQTDEGGAVLQACKAALRKKPLVLKTNIVEEVVE